MAKSLKKAVEDNVQRMQEFSEDMQKDLICQEDLLA